MARVVALVQARCSSERLPGKVLLPLAGRSVVSHVITAVRHAALVDDVILATSDLAADDPLAEAAQCLGVRVFRGSERDVLGRFRAALDGDNADVVVRQVADAPLADPAIIDRVIGAFLKGGCDYASNVVDRTFPRGMECEVFSREALENSHLQGQRPEDREHVTIHIRTHPEFFRLRNVRALPQETWPELRVTLDTREDYCLLEQVFTALYRPGEILRAGVVMGWLRQHPEIATLNAHVAQKAVLGKVF